LFFGHSLVNRITPVVREPTPTETIDPRPLPSHVDETPENDELRKRRATSVRQFGTKTDAPFESGILSL